MCNLNKQSISKPTLKTHALCIIYIWTWGTIVTLRRRGTKSLTTWQPRGPQILHMLLIDETIKRVSRGPNQLNLLVASLVDRPSRRVRIGLQESHCESIRGSRPLIHQRSIFTLPSKIFRMNIL